MSKRRREPTFKELVESLPPEAAGGGEVVRSVVDTGVIGEWARSSWQLQRGPLDIRVARRLVASADLVLLGNEGSVNLKDVPDGERDSTWERAGQRYEGPGGEARGPAWPQEPLYNAFEFRSEDGRTLLLIDVSC